MAMGSRRDFPTMGLLHSEPQNTLYGLQKGRPMFGNAKRAGDQSGGRRIASRMMPEDDAYGSGTKTYTPYNPYIIHYSSFHFLFHYSHITPIYYNIIYCVSGAGGRPPLGSYQYRLEAQQVAQSRLRRCMVQCTPNNCNTLPVTLTKFPTTTETIKNTNNVRQ